MKLQYSVAEHTEFETFLHRQAINLFNRYGSNAVFHVYEVAISSDELQNVVYNELIRMVDALCDSSTKGHNPQPLLAIN